MQIVDLDYLKELIKIKKQVVKSHLDGEKKWDYICGFLMITSTIVYLTPLSLLTQHVWHTFIPDTITNTQEQIAISKVPKDKTFTGNLARSPKEGEVISGYVVTSDWGKRNVKVGSKFHRGVDIGLPTGTSVYLIGEDKLKVTCWEDKSGGGLTASFTLTNGTSFDYMHLSKCETGEYIPGSVIALSGNTGISSGEHLHITQKDKEGNKIPPHYGYVHWAITGNKP
jgi:murein DD-endopeptidase MepM/ murein hydrolase activator NlpD